MTSQKPKKTAPELNSENVTKPDGDNSQRVIVTGNNNVVNVSKSERKKQSSREQKKSKKKMPVGIAAALIAAAATIIVGVINSPFFVKYFYPDVPQSTDPIATVVVTVLFPQFTETFVPSFTPSPTTASSTATPVMELDDGGIMMRFIPGGDFIMGSNLHDDNEAKAHNVKVDSFYIDKFEVTNEMYKKCVEKESCASPTDRIYFLNAGYRNYPVVFVNWDMAVNYCKWRGARLPTEAEWEKAARGENERIYPWGNQYFGNMANFCDEKCSFTWANSLYDDDYASLSPVGFYLEGESFYGISDMAGNVWEWVSSLYKDYPYNSLDGREDMSLQGSRVMRGGSWGSSLYHLRTTVRRFERPTQTNNFLGFRCAKDAP